MLLAFSSLPSITYLFDLPLFCLEKTYLFFLPDSGLSFSSCQILEPCVSEASLEEGPSPRASSGRMWDRVLPCKGVCGWAAGVASARPPVETVTFGHLRRLWGHSFTLSCGFSPGPCTQQGSRRGRDSKDRWNGKK